LINNSNLHHALERFASGEFVIVTDDENRENEGDLILLATAATKEKLAFMIRYTSGVICVAMTEARSRQLHLPLMVKQNQDTKRTAFTVTVDAKSGLTTGISAEERAKTILALSDPRSTAEDFIRPGHIFPLVSHELGLLGRQGHTEAAVEMARLVKASPVGVISELVHDDGSMLRGSALAEFAEKHQIPLITIRELIAELEGQEPRLPEGSFAPSFDWARLPRKSSEYWKIAAVPGSDGIDHVLIMHGELLEEDAPLVRIHSECLTGDVFGSLRCDCGDQLESAMEKIEKQGSGLVIYLRNHEGRGIGISEKIKAYQLQEKGLDTVEANLALGHGVDERDFLDAVSILRNLKINKLRLLTNNPKKLAELRLAGLDVQEVNLHVEKNPYNSRYIETKENKLGHRK
jgi:3,4-dihydroxy 2-butanone 4-phosphate synthase/GTP cyclohydrolase II